MTAATLSLTDFLLARIADDQWLARIQLQRRLGLVDAPTPAQQQRIDKTCAVALIELHANWRRFAVEFWTAFPWRWAGRGWLRKLALPYADHADFRDEWRA